jgi:hypothetical protein
MQWALWRLLDTTLSQQTDVFLLQCGYDMSFLAISRHDKVFNNPADHRRALVLENCLFQHGSKYECNVVIFSIIAAQN